MHKTKKILIAIATGSAIGIGVAVMIFLLKLSVHGKFPPGTTISGIDISYKTPQETKEILLEAKERYLNTPLKITAANTAIVITPKELGVDVLVDKTLQIIEETDATEMSLSILTKIDYKNLISKINEKFELDTSTPQAANFYFDENYQLAIKEGKSGLVLDEEGLIENLKSSAKQLISADIALALRAQQPKITKKTLQQHEELIKESLRHEFVLIDPVYSDDWEENLIDHLDWVEFTQETKDIIKIEINQKKLNEYIEEEISRWLDVPAEPLNIYTDENGEIVIEGKGNKGLEIQREQLKKSIELAVAHKIRDIPIPVMEIEPEINVSQDLQELGIKELIGVGHTSYYGSPNNRVHNIKTGASKFNGNLIAPDEIFSFNQNLGRVDSSTGYRKELVIKPEGTIPEYGGGLCQVSTTTYRAILLSGLPVEERNPHSYAVSYYSQILGHGLDATIYLGGADVKFRNDTGHHILIQTYTKDDYELYIAFYGTSDGRSVELEGPYLSNYHNPGPTIYVDTTNLPPGTKKQVERAHTGFNALWYRYITNADGEITTETIKTAYKAIPAKILVGTETIPSQ